MYQHVNNTHCMGSNYDSHIIDDHSRVILQNSPDGSDYINASYIEVL